MTIFKPRDFDKADLTALLTLLPWDDTLEHWFNYLQRARRHGLIDSVEQGWLVAFRELAYEARYTGKL